VDPVFWKLILVVIGLVGAMTGSTTPTRAATAVIQFLPRVETTAELNRYLNEDQQWLKRQPAELLTVPAPDSLQATRRWLEQVRRAAGTPVEARLADVPIDSVTAQAGVRDLVSLLRDRWFARGYLGATVTRRKAADSVTLWITPGPLYRLGRLDVAGEEFPGRSWILDSSLPSLGTVFRAESWSLAVQQLLAGVGDQGYPFAHWLVKDVRVVTSRAEVWIEATLIPGVQVFLGPVTSDLPEGRGEGFLAKAARLNRGAMFQESEIQRARERLLARDHYAWVGTPVVYLTTASDTVGIHWPVIPRERPNRLSVVLGFSQGSDDDASRLSGQVDLLLPDLAGTGRRLNLVWSDDGRERSHFGFGYLEPFALGTPLDAELIIDHEVLTGQYTKFRIDTRGQLPVVAAWGIEVGLGWDRTTFPQGSIESTRRLRARGAFLHRRIDPAKSGWSGVFAVEAANRQATARVDTNMVGSSPATGSQDRQRIFEADLDGEIWLGRFVSLASRATFREVSGLSGPIPLAEQYWFGGAKTVRGYRENEFHGERIAYGSLEMRVGKFGGARLYTFYDLGYFDFSALAPTEMNPEQRVERRGTVRGFGTGLQTRMPGGVISLAVGFPGKVNYDEAKLHVSLLGIF
jgi:outer membrane protein assembly factor BamA